MGVHGVVVGRHHVVVGTHVTLWRRMAIVWARGVRPCVIVGDHDANCGRVWTPRRDIVGAHVDAHV